MFVFALLPFFDFKGPIKSSMFKGIYKKFFWFFLFNLFYLGFLGAALPVSPYIELGLICTHLHLFFFFLIVPFLNTLEYFFLFRKQTFFF